MRLFLYSLRETVRSGSVLSGEDWSVSMEAGLPFTGKPIPPMDWPMIVSGICRKMRMDASG
ncbi:hypothetical protein [Phocaeicola barnesiae]|uniref:hypothetical protein n=1 Tax=Phocaeicola barnesiae TaxID=376804 RepID=UPI00241C9993|nr:hypothetical protein [Phocaeicola barnesiae]